MSDSGNNIYKYMTSDRKLRGENSKTETRSMIEYFEKSTGVFNGDGGITKQHLQDIQERAKAPKNLWHGFISLNEEMSSKIDSAEKCAHLVKRTFGDFFKDMGINPQNVDLICALHKDRPHHLHIHFWFAEKEPKFKYHHKQLEYRHKGKIEKAVLDRMHVRLNLYVENSHPDIYQYRDAAIKELKKLTANIEAVKREDVKKAVLALAKEIPKNASFFYGKKDMEPYREKVDEIARLIIIHDRRANKANKNFYMNLIALKRKINSLCDVSENSTNHYKIDPQNITMVDDIEADFKRRQGNVILAAVKSIKSELFVTKIQHRVNDKPLKRRLAISRYKVGKLFDQFMLSFIDEIEAAGNEYSKQMKEREEAVEAESLSTPKSGKYNWGK